jgi:hypothetical protein
MKSSKPTILLEARWNNAMAVIFYRAVAPAVVEGDSDLGCGCIQ